MRGQTLGTYAELLYAMPASGAPVANTTTRTLLSQLGAGLAYKLPAGFFPPGSGAGNAIQVVAAGFYSTTATPTLKFTASLDTAQGTFGTALAGTGSFTAESSITNYEFFMSFTATCQSLGTAGSLASNGTLGHGQPGSVAAGTETFVGIPAGVAINTSVDNWVEIWATWGTASASNTVTLTQFQVFGLN